LVANDASGVPRSNLFKEIGEGLNPKHMERISEALDSVHQLGVA